MRRLLTLLLVLLPAMLCAQASDFGTEYGLSYALRTWKGAELTLGQELRLKDNSRRFAKSETSLDLQQQLLRHALKPYDMRLRIGGGYSFIYRQNASHLSYPQHRFVLQTSLTRDWGPLRLGFRTRLQSTWRDPRLGSYRVNPQHYLRLRLSARYAIAHTPWQLGLSHEGFIALSSPQSPLYDECRTQLSATYKINKHQSITLYGKLSQELQTPAPETFYALGLTYQFD